MRNTVWRLLRAGKYANVHSVCATVYLLNMGYIIYLTWALKMSPYFIKQIESIRLE